MQDISGNPTGSVSAVDDVQCEGCMSTVWLGDGEGRVSVVDYRQGRSRKVSTGKVLGHGAVQFVLVLCIRDLLVNLCFQLLLMVYH